MKFLASLLSLLIAVPVFTFAQSQECSTPCISNVTGTTCQVSDWVCLCGSQTFLNTFNQCVVSSCNSTSDRQGAFAAIDQICEIFGVTVTNTPEATFSGSSLPSGIPPLNVTLSAISPSTTGSRVISITAITTQPANSSTSAVNGTSTLTPGSQSVTSLAATTGAGVGMSTVTSMIEATASSNTAASQTTGSTATASASPTGDAPTLGGSSMLALAIMGFALCFFL